MRRLGRVIYLHPDDYARLRAVQDLIKEDARRALNAKLAELNGRPSLLGKRKGRKQYKIAAHDWSFEFYADTEGAVPQGDVEIHSELNETPQPGYREAFAPHGRAPAIRASRAGR